MLLWSVVPLGNQDVWLHLTPLHTALCTIDTQADIISLTSSNLRSLQQSCKALICMHKCARIIIHRTTLRHTLQISTNLRYLCSSHILHQVPSVRSDIAHATALTSLLWIVTPHGIVAALQLDSLCEPALRILHKDTAHLTNHARSNSALHLLHSRIATVNMGQGKCKTSLLHLLTQRQSLLQYECHRLIQHHIETQLQGSRRRCIMEAVRSHDCDKIHSLALWQRSLLLQHLLPGKVNAVVGHKVLTTRAQRDFRINREASAHKVDTILHQGSTTMNSADKRIATAADHTHSQFSVFHFIVLSWLIISRSNHFSKIKHNFLSPQLFPHKTHTLSLKNRKARSPQ